MEKINISIENFEGPLDLILRLIRINKMEITDISIYEITDQYMTILRNMEVLDMEIASEFFVTAATLIDMKSRELLPKKRDQEKGEDSGKLLLRRLKEYEFFKKAALEMSKNYSADEVYITRLPMTIEEEKTVELIIPKGFTQENFFVIYMELLDRMKEKINIRRITTDRIHADSFKVEDKMEEIESKLKFHKRMSFEKILSESSCKAETIVLFLAVLELVKNHSLKIYQSESLGELILEEGESDVEGRT